MSNTRVFNYQEITSIYDQMNQIIGDSSDPSTIAGLLHKIDEDYHEVVNGPAGEDELALRGDLGMQLLNNWENTAGSFPAFVENFSSWSTLVAQTAGDYSAFEEQVRGIRSDNPLGWNTGGIQNGYVASSSYTNTYTDAELDEAAAAVQMYDLVGAYYVDTGMVSYAKKAAFWNGFGDVLSVVSIVASGCSLVKGLGIVGGAAKGASAAGTAGKAVVDQSDEVITGVGKAAAGQTDEIVTGVGKAAASQTDEVIAGAGQNIAKEGAKSIDDLVAEAGKMNTKDKVAFVEKLRADGTISNSDDFLKFFGGKESVAKTAYTAYNGGSGGGAAVREILGGYKSVAADAGKAVLKEGAEEIVTGAAGTVSTEAGKQVSSGIFNTAKTKLAGMSDKAIAKVMGLSDDMVDAIKVDGGTVRGYALEALKSNSVVAEKIINAGSSIKAGISSGVSKAGTYLSGAGQSIKTGLSTAGTWVKENGVTVLKETVKQNAVGLATNTGQNLVNNANIQRNAEMVASAREHFGNNGN